MKKVITATESIQNVRTLKITTFWATHPILRVSLLLIRSNHPLCMGIQNSFCFLFFLNFIASAILIMSLRIKLVSLFSEQTVQIK